jgi:hypothetical protein
MPSQQWFNVKISHAQQSNPKINQLPGLALKTFLSLAMKSMLCLLQYVEKARELTAGYFRRKAPNNHAAKFQTLTTRNWGEE